MITSFYIFYRAGTTSLNSALIELAFLSAIAFCTYLSYRLIVVINGTLS